MQIFVFTDCQNNRFQNMNVDSERNSFVEYEYMNTLSTVIDLSAPLALILFDCCLNLLVLYACLYCLILYITFGALLGIMVEFESRVGTSKAVFIDEVAVLAFCKQIAKLLFIHACSGT